MKKVIRLTESDLTRIIKRVIQEEITEDKLSVDPFVLWASDKGGLWIKDTSTGKQIPYKMEVYKGMIWIDCLVKDFPGGTKMHITVPAVGQERKIPVDKNDLLNLLTKNFGKSEIRKKFGEHEVKFTKK